MVKLEPLSPYLYVTESLIKVVHSEADKRVGHLLSLRLWVHSPMRRRRPNFLGAPSQNLCWEINVYISAQFEPGDLSVRSCCRWRGWSCSRRGGWSGSGRSSPPSPRQGRRSATSFEILHDFAENGCPSSADIKLSSWMQWLDLFDFRPKRFLQFLCVCQDWQSAHISLSWKTHYPLDTGRLIAFQYEDLCSFI